MIQMTRKPGNPPGLPPDGPALRRLREERGITAAAMARAIGRDRRTVERAERSHPTSTRTARQIARVLTRRTPDEPVSPRDFIPGWMEDDEETDAEDAA